MKIKQYSSGLRLVVNYKKDMDIVSFRIFVNVASKDEKENGLISEIKEGVKLKGATIQDNIAFVSLSSDFLLSDDTDGAAEEIYKTLHNNLGVDGLVVIVDDTIVIKK